MTITFVLFYYRPEMPTQNYIYQPIIDRLLALGHQVNILTPNPTRGVTLREQKKYARMKEEVEGNLHIYRVKCFTYHPHRFTKLKLALRYLSVSLKLTRKVKHLKSDVIFTQTNPPLLLSYLVARFAKRRGIKLIYNVQDIYPDNIFSPRSLIYRLSNPFQVATLKHATTVITISETMKATLASKISHSDKIKVIYNFAISEYQDDQQARTVQEKLSIDPHKFNVIYAGNIGYVQDLDVLLRAASLTSQHHDIHYHIVGEGSQADRIRQKIIDLRLDKVFFHPVLPVEEAIYLYYLADVNIISILPHVIHTALPLKVASCLAARKPIVFIGLEENLREPWLDTKPITPIRERNYVDLAKHLQFLSTNPHSDIVYYDECFNKKTNIDAYITLILSE